MHVYIITYTGFDGGDEYHETMDDVYEDKEECQAVVDLLNTQAKEQNINNEYAMVTADFIPRKTKQ